MELNPNDVLILLCLVTVASYLFNIISQRLRVPSVVLLIGSGIAAQQIVGPGLVSERLLKVMLEFLGSLGLIFIVLEGSMDLKVTRDKRPVIIKSMAAAVAVLLATSASIAAILYYTLDMTAQNALVYAVPMGVISSAIAIPSVDKLRPEKKDFIIYESTFSDILGIMLFNYVVADEITSMAAVGSFLWQLVLIVLVSVASTAAILLLFRYLNTHIRVFLILALLILVYSVGKTIHLPSLLLILVFGLVLNNIEPLLVGPVSRLLDGSQLATISLELKTMTAELAFLIRTFFFLVFGYSIDLMRLANTEVLLTGGAIMGTILVLRYLSLRFISRTNVFPELFVAPRGLITIILFYSIPARFISPRFDEGVLTFVILSSSIIMTLGLLLSRKAKPEALDEDISELNRL